MAADRFARMLPPNRACPRGAPPMLMAFSFLSHLALTLPKLRLTMMAGIVALLAVVANFTIPAMGETQRAEFFREGQAVRGLQGLIERQDGRYVFVSLDKKQRFPILENLALERVTRALDDSITPLTWNVSGSMTEYRGHNFLLLQSARLSERE